MGFIRRAAYGTGLLAGGAPFAAGWWVLRGTQGSRDRAAMLKAQKENNRLLGQQQKLAKKQLRQEQAANQWLQIQQAQEFQQMAAYQQQMAAYQQQLAYDQWARTPFWTGDRWITQDGRLEWDGQTWIGRRSMSLPDAVLPSA